jgi:anthranilate synthase component 2
VTGNGEALKVLLIDNFDSFSFNLVDELRKRDAEVHVWRNDIDVEHAFAILEQWTGPRLVVLSPGPGSPRDAGCCIELVKRCEAEVPVFGVCLGHQAIVEAFGGEVAYAGEVVHGKTARVDHDGSGPFTGLPSPMYAARYHSLAAKHVPSPLTVTARTGDIVMAVEHQSAPIVGVQFHPESILTPRGGCLIEGVIQWATVWAPAG